MSEYSYMEFEWATGIAWHIRHLSSKGKCFGGGADTPSLCGVEHRGWDVNHAPPKPGPKPDFVCGRCWEEFERVLRGEVIHMNFFLDEGPTEEEQAYHGAQMLYPEDYGAEE